MKQWDTPQFLPKDRLFRDWRKALIENAADIEGVKAALIEIMDKHEERANKDRDLIENNVGVIRGSVTPNNWLKGTDFRILNGTAPEFWTLSGAGGTISLQTGRTGGNTLNKAVRIAAGAGNSVKLTQSVELFPGELYSLAGWVKPVTGTGRLRIVTTGAATNLGKPIAFDAARWTTFRPFPTDQLREGWFRMPTDATTLTVELEADISSSLDFCELQGGPGPMREPTLWTPGHDDGQRDGEYTPTGTGVVNITTVTPGVFQYFRVGSRVYASGPVVVDPANPAGGATTFRLSLPVTSNIGAAADASGWVVEGPNGISGDVTGVAATDDVLVGFLAPNGNQLTVQVGFSYKVI